MAPRQPCRVGQASNVTMYFTEYHKFCSIFSQSRKNCALVMRQRILIMFFNFANLINKFFTSVGTFELLVTNNMFTFR